MKLINKFHIYSLIKVGERRYIEPLLKKGEIYLNTIEYYRAEDLLEGVKDQYEGFHEICKNPKISTFNYETKKVIEFPDVKEIRGHCSDVNQGNIYCMYAIKADHPTIKIRGKDIFIGSLNCKIAEIVIYKSLTPKNLLLELTMLVKN